MKVRQYEMVEVQHSRSGKWRGIATRDFDTETEEWYPLELAGEGPCPTFASEAYRDALEPGMKMPCRASHVSAIRIIFE